MLSNRKAEVLSLIASAELIGRNSYTLDRRVLHFDGDIRGKLLTPRALILAPKKPDIHKI